MQDQSKTILFGKYELLSKLGTGEFSSVYLSRHLLLGCYRAIKFIPKEHGKTDTLLQEAQLLKSLCHTGIPAIYDIEEDESFFYLIEEYLEGESLEEFLLQQSTISQTTYWDLSLQLCDIFQYLHSFSPSPILYLDLKPEHIIVCGMQLKLLDFNVATYLSNLGNFFNLFGNEDFTAPELFSGAKPNLLSDIYSIGKIMEYLSNYLDVPISPKLQKIIKKATDTEPACRFETVDELISAIKKEKKLFSQPHTRKEIALVGSHSGCGTTHLAIALVSTLNYMGYSAVYYSQNKDLHLQEVPEIFPAMRESQGQLFYKYFKGYPFYGEGICIPPENVDFAIYDYGNTLPTRDSSDLILFLCNHSLWHWYHALDKGQALLKYKDSLKIICNFGERKAMHLFSQQFGQPVYSYPYDRNPFLVDKQKLLFTTKLLNLKRRGPLFFPLKNIFLKRKL